MRNWRLVTWPVHLQVTVTDSYIWGFYKVDKKLARGGNKTQDLVSN